tara:strand:+ start:2833 stop:3600 length:768 start_codon:yes stop_codon:yes gene_type:complete
MSLFDPQLVNTSGCELPTLPLTAEQNQILQSVLSGEFLRNPLEGINNFATETLVDLFDEVGSVVAPGQEGSLSAIQEILANASNELTLMAAHSDRLSGIDSNPQNIQGLQGIQSIARTFNNFKNSIEGGTIGDDLVDYYTPFFSSILGPGTTNFEIVKGLITGDFTNALQNAQGLPGANGEAIADMLSISQSVDQAVGVLKALRESDVDALAGALDYLAKTGLGFSILGMAEDPCFSQKVLQNIVNPDLKGLLNL